MLIIPDKPEGDGMRFHSISIIAIPAISAAVFLIAGCAPIPAIQSARVKHGYGYTFDLISKSEELEILYKDSSNYPGSHVRTYHGKPAIPISKRSYLRLALKNRVEINLSLLPGGGLLKIALFDAGSDLLFRNISSALFAGGDYYFVDQTSSLFGGIITGTHCKIVNCDFELVLMTYGTRFFMEYSDDQIPDYNLYYKAANASLGFIFTPSRRGNFALSAGVTGRFIFNRNLTLEHLANKDEFTVQKFKIYPFIFQCGMQLGMPWKN